MQIGKYRKDGITTIHNKHYESRQITSNFRLVIKEEPSSFLLIKIGTISQIISTATDLTGDYFYVQQAVNDWV